MSQEQTVGDPRVRRTRAHLRAAALEAVTRGGRVSASAVARCAGVNRATLYQHYRDLDELVVDALSDEVAVIAGAAGECPFDEPGATPPVLVRLFEHVDGRAALLAQLLGAEGSGRFGSELNAALTRVLADRFASGARPPVDAAVGTRTQATFLAGGLTRLIAEFCIEPDRDAALAAQQTWLLIRGRPQPAPAA